MNSIGGDFLIADGVELFGLLVGAGGEVVEGEVEAVAPVVGVLGVGLGGEGDGLLEVGLTLGGVVEEVVGERTAVWAERERFGRKRFAFLGRHEVSPIRPAALVC